MFTVQLSVKPYVRQHLINQFGEPCDFSISKPGDYLNAHLLRMLRKPIKRDELRIPKSLTSTIEIQISQDIFYRYGWELTRHDMLRFNMLVENEIKFLSRAYIAFDKSLGIAINTSIRNFQDEYKFTEDSFPYETIKKDFDRNAQYIKFDKVDVFATELKKIFLAQMSDFIQVKNK